MQQRTEQSSVKPQQRFYFPQIDGLRFVAAALVILHHYEASDIFVLQKINAIGWIGVDIFLVLSAFLIFSLLLIEHVRTGAVSLRRFYIRRILRIQPLYFPYLIIILLVLPVIPVGAKVTLDQQALILKQQALPFLTFLGNFSYAYFPQSFNILYSHLWTICLEEQFYLVAPFIVLLFGAHMKRWTLVATFLIIAFCAIWRVYMVASVPYPMVWVSPVTRADPFAVGALCAVLVRYHPRLLAVPYIGLALALAGIAGYGVIAATPQIGSTFHTTWQLALSAISGGMLVLSALSHWGIGRVLSWRPLPFLGKISFGLYVYHELSLDVTDAVRRAGYVSNYWVRMMLVFGMCIAISTVSYLFYERYFLRLKERFEAVRSRPA